MEINIEIGPVAGGKITAFQLPVAQVDRESGMQSVATGGVRIRKKKGRRENLQSSTRAPQLRCVEASFAER